MSSLNQVTRHGHLFVDGQDEYLFVKTLGCGPNSQAQLVLHLQTGELRVRKVTLRHLDKHMKKSEDKEKVIFYQQDQATSRARSTAQFSLSLLGC